MTAPTRFPRCARLRVSAQFQAVFGEGKRFSGSNFRLHVLPTTEHGEPRLGVTVSKRVAKHAVVRNRIRRQIKECFRLQRPTLPVADYVFLAKPEAARADNGALRNELLSLLERARTLKPVVAACTMPPSEAIADRNSTAT